MPMLSKHCDLFRVRAVGPCRGGTEITFANGTTACVPAGAPDGARFIAGANAARVSGEHVGLLLSDAGEVLDLSPGRVSTVAFIRQDEERADRLIVGFWAFGTLCYLMKDHPDFERLHRMLQGVAGTETPVLFANHSHHVEDEDESWWRLLDARLVDSSDANGAEKVS
jgi:hypothetical protein